MYILTMRRVMFSLLYLNVSDELMIEYNIIWDEMTMAMDITVING